MPPDINDILLSSWTFNDSTWYSDWGYAPLTYTNLSNPTNWDGNDLQMDSTNAAFLQYNIVEADDTTNLTFDAGTIELWFRPDWTSGVGPGDWGRLIEVGEYVTNAPSSWWSLYFTDDGSSLNFSSSVGTNVVFTNYLSAPISWSAGTWYFVALTYDQSATKLYINGQLATSGSGVQYTPSATALTNGFFVGSDDTGTAQMRGQMDDLAAWNFVISAGNIAYAYQEGTNYMAGGDTGTTTNTPSYSYDFGTNLNFAQMTFSDGMLNVGITNAQLGTLYEIQSRTNLSVGDWTTEAFLDSSELTNWLAASVPSRTNNTLFLRIRSWQDSTGTTIPDWWWIKYFGQITNVDAYAEDPAGDTHNNLQKFQLGLNPNLYFNSNAPAGFFGCFDASGTNVVLGWSNAPGPVLNYVIDRGIYNTNTGDYDYTQFTVSSNVTFFQDFGIVSNANAQLDLYSLHGVYPGGTTTGTNTWYVNWYSNLGSLGLPYGPSPVADVYAYATATGTNVLLSWTPSQSPATNYLIFRGILNTNTYNYEYTQIAAVDTNTTVFTDTGVINDENAWNDVYQVQAMFQGQGLSQPVSASINTNPPPPTGFSAALDSTGTNVILSWTAPQGVTISGYVIERGVVNPDTGSYTFSSIGSVDSSATSFQDTGAITGDFSYFNAYKIDAVYPGGGQSDFASFYLQGPPPAPSTNLNVRVGAQLVRGPSGEWEIIFSYIPPEAQSINVMFDDYLYDSDADYSDIVSTNVSVGNLTNNCFIIPNAYATNISDPVFNEQASLVNVQPVTSNGVPGDISKLGFIYNDAPYFVDGRQHLKQNLLFKLRAATVTTPRLVFDTMFNDYAFDYVLYQVPSDVNYVESSIFHSAYQFKYYMSYDDPGLQFTKMNDLWPFAENYQLHNGLYDTNHLNVPSTFVWTNNLETVPAPAVLAVDDPYWISQNVISSVTDPGTGLQIPVFTSAILDLAGYTNSGNLYLENNSSNLFGLAFASALLNTDPWTTIAPGGSVAITNTSVFYSQTADSNLELDDYYFAIVNTPGTALPGNIAQEQNQSQPIPANVGFSNTNQTGLLIGSVGNPLVVGGWARYSIQNGNPTKCAYLGQYFVTNAFIFNPDGSTSTNSAGIVSPYGEFLPTQHGLAEISTMPDIDPPYQQGTGVVRVVSLNVDADHDGTMDLSYFSADQALPSRPFRFWVNDDQDVGDDGGNDGIPGQVFGQADATADAGLYNYSNPNPNEPTWRPFYRVHGRRDLVDFFPVYINIGSLFQSNALSAGINYADTNWQFVLSQADSALRFVYTDLTPTNYMKFLWDTNESGTLADATAWPIVSINNYPTPLPQSFIANIATNNGGILLVESAKPTTEPLVLTIYHGTNQTAQTSLPLSITGVEKMFRSKTMLLDSDSSAVPDRLTDADVPNEPDTTDKNFVFIHGYNVNPQEARGNAADVFKRMYWSGSHAKFWAITWEGSDTKDLVHNAITPDYHINVEHAFDTAPLLASFITSLTNSGLVTVAAHSLGNMLTLDAINDYSTPISQYFMLDAAVPLEAVDAGDVSINTNMVFSSWRSYTNSLYASDWYQLWPTNDGRSMLAWSNRLANFNNVQVYNFYSSGEEVLREYDADPPLDVLSTIDLLKNYVQNHSPLASFVWVFQEKGKGQSLSDLVLGSTHGGWKFNTNYDSLTVTQANALPNSELQTNAFFDFTSLSFFYDAALYDTYGSLYAQTNHNRILSDAIPALTLPVGANPVSRLAPPKSPNQRNFDMQILYENGWPLGRGSAGYPNGTTAAGEWHHSDFHQVAYTFTYQLFNKLVTLGNLK